jgi:hypothetical protein
MTLPDATNPVRSQRWICGSSLPMPLAPAPAWHATLQDQLRRALLRAYLGIAEASRRQGGERLCLFRWARGKPASRLMMVLNLLPRATS